MKKHRTNRLAALAVVFAAAHVAACSDDPVAPEEEDEHAEAEGAQVLVDGAVVATYDGDEQSWTGELEVEVGEESGMVEVRFVDHDGDPVPIDDDLYLEVSVEDTTIAEFHHEPAPGSFTGHFDGKAEGETDVVFMLMHGAVGSGHSDFTTTAVHIHVEGES